MSNMFLGRLMLNFKRNKIPVVFAIGCLVLLFRAPVDISVNSENRSTKEKENPIRQISILGERNSGTRWTFDHISECFNHTVVVTRTLTRYKHWFQYRNESRYLHDTLVLAQFRNPYDWLMAMEHVPHHSPAHLRTMEGATTDFNTAQNDYKIFLSKPWTTERTGADLLMKGDEMCQENFRYKDIVSCSLEPLPREHYNYTTRYSEQQPFYEMRNDGSGLPYDNIMEMRADKIRNFMTVSDYSGVSDVWNLQYEYLVSKGTQQLLDRIEAWTGISPSCEAKPPQVRPPKASRILNAEHAAYIREHLDWGAEDLIGYKPEPMREQVEQDVEEAEER